MSDEISPPVSDTAVSVNRSPEDKYLSTFSHIGNPGQDVVQNNQLTEPGTAESHKQDTLNDDFLAVSSGVDGLSIVGSESSPPMQSSPPLRYTGAIPSHEDTKDGHEDERELSKEEEGYEEQSQPEPIEPSPLEYGRTNGLMRDYLTEKYDEVENLPSTSMLIPIDNNLPQCSLGEGLKVEERMVLSRDGAALLASISQEDTSATIDSMIISMLELQPPQRYLRRLKLELPLLRSDNNTDCKNFAKKNDFEIKLEDIKLPLEAVDDENGQGLGWPARFWDIGPRLLEELKKKKISIPRATIRYFAKCVKVDWTEHDSQQLWDSEVTYKRNPALEPITPPMSPIYTKSKPLEPTSSDSAFNVPLFSDPLSPTRKELEEIEAKIFQNDVPSPLRQKTQNYRLPSASSSTYAGDDLVKPRDVYSPLASVNNSDPLALYEPERMKREDLKIEEILTPEGPSISLPKTVRFNEIVEELRIDSFQSRVNSPAFENRFFEKAFVPAAALANQKLEQEELIEADATARIDVPLMDFSKSDPPWSKFEGHKDLGSLLLMQKSFIRETISPAQIWRGGKQANLRMKWIPFDKDKARVVIDAYIAEDEEILDLFLRFPTDKEIIDSSSLTWKPFSLMIFREDEDDDDEIEPGRFIHNAPMNLTSLVKKRKLKLEEKATAQTESGPAKTLQKSGQAILSGQPSNRGLSSTKTILNSVEKPLNDFVSATEKIIIDADEQDFGILLGGTFSAENSLHNYLEVRGNKKQKLTDSSYFGRKISKSLQKPALIQENHLLFKEKPTQEQAGSLPTPAIPPQTTKSSIIIASSLLKQRGLVKHLHVLLPSLELVERDFSAHDTTTWMPGTVTRSPIVSPLAAEADLIVSSSTGILVTTLQKIKQKLLPGQKGKPAIRSRVEQVSLRYEKLVVFVSEGRQDESTNGLDESDSLAFSDFIGFTLGLDVIVNVQLVAGGEETLAKWIAGAVSQCSLPDSQELLLEETLWELFLRRAGMNAFAAQAVIVELKAPDGVNSSSPTKAGQFGLTVFVEMGHAERVARFGRICGKRLLERVGAVIDAKWEI